MYRADGMVVDGYLLVEHCIKCFIIILQQLSFYKNYNFYLFFKKIEKKQQSHQPSGFKELIVTSQYKKYLLIVFYQKNDILQIYKLQTSWMSDVQLYQNYKKLYSAFYDKITKKHSNRTQLARKFTNFIAKVPLPENDTDQNYLRTITPRKSNNLEITNEFQSLRMTNSTSKNTLQANRSRVSKRSDSSRDKSECESKFFGVDWVYSSVNSQRVIVFALLASYILNENSVGFLILRDRIDEEMINNPHAIPPILMVAISKYWQRIAEIVTKKKSYLWEKYLKEPVDRMPLQFNKLIAKIIVGKQLENCSFTKEVLAKLSKEGRINIANFNINFRQIQKVEHQGEFKKQIVIGYLKHKNTYVLANKMPEYSQIQLKNRKIRALIQSNIEELLQEYKADEQQMNLLEDNKLPKQKDKIIKEFFSKKLALLKPI